MCRAQNATHPLGMSWNIICPIMLLDKVPRKEQPKQIQAKKKALTQKYAHLLLLARSDPKPPLISSNSVGTSELSIVNFRIVDKTDPTPCLLPSSDSWFIVSFPNVKYACHSPISSRDKTPLGAKRRCTRRNKSYPREVQSSLTAKPTIMRKRQKQH